MLILMLGIPLGFQMNYLIKWKNEWLNLFFHSIFFLILNTRKEYIIHGMLKANPVTNSIVQNLL